MNISLDVNIKAVENLKKAVRNATIERLKDYARLGHVELKELTEVPKVFAHWMSIILVAGRHVRVTIKAHYMTESAKKLTAKSCDLTEDEVTDKQAADFMKELCNLVAGTTKKVLENNSLSGGISLPLTVRGFDEVFFSSSSGHYSATDQWELVCDEAKIDFSVHLEVYCHFELNNIEGFGKDDEDLGEVEYL